MSSLSFFFDWICQRLSTMPLAVFSDRNTLSLSRQHITPIGDREKQIAAASGQTWPRLFFMDIDTQQLNLSGKCCTLLCFYLTDSESVNDQQNIGAWNWIENEKRCGPKWTFYRISAFWLVTYQSVGISFAYHSVRNDKQNNERWTFCTLANNAKRWDCVCINNKTRKLEKLGLPCFCRYTGVHDSLYLVQSDTK